MPGKGHADWRAQCSGRPPFYGEPRAGRSCAGLHAVARQHNFTFGMMETAAPHWLGCPRVRYTFLISDPVKRIVTYALNLGGCLARNGSWYLRDGCDPMKKVRRWYSERFSTDRGVGAFMGTPAVNDYHVRMLLDRDAFAADLDALNASHLQRAKERLSTFALAAALSSEDRNTSTLTPQALGWEGALRNERCGFWASTHSYVQQAREPLLHGAWAATIAEHNKLDLELYRWLREAPVVRGQRHSEARSRN